MLSVMMKGMTHRKTTCEKYKEMDKSHFLLAKKRVIVHEIQT